MGTLEELLVAFKRLKFDFINIVSASMQVQSGCRVWHKTHLAGTVEKIHSKDPLQPFLKTYQVQFDNGDARTYSAESMQQKLYVIPFSTSGKTIELRSKLRDGDMLWHNSLGLACV